jgi:hypothetical protein
MVQCVLGCLAYLFAPTAALLQPSSMQVVPHHTKGQLSDATVSCVSCCCFWKDWAHVCNTATVLPSLL